MNLNVFILNTYTYNLALRKPGSKQSKTFNKSVDREIRSLRELQSSLIKMKNTDNEKFGKTIKPFFPDKNAA